MSVIVIAMPNLEDAKRIGKILVSRGFTQVRACTSASRALQEAGGHSHGLVISGCRLRDMCCQELADSLPRHFELLLLGSPGAVSEAASGILSLTTPVRAYDLVNTVEMVLRQLEKRVRKDKKPRKRSEPEENYIRNAKFLLMERNHLSEEEAFRYIQKCSMDNSTNMVETAQMILTLMFQE